MSKKRVKIYHPKREEKKPVAVKSMVKKDANIPEVPQKFLKRDQLLEKGWSIGYHKRNQRWTLYRPDGEEYSVLYSVTNKYTDKRVHFQIFQAWKEVFDNVA